MGIDINTYLGPYAQVECEVVKKTISRCKQPNNCPLHELPIDVKFCPSCGLKAKDVEQVREDAVVDESFTYENGFDDRLTVNSGMCGPSSYVKSGKKFYLYCFMPNSTKFDWAKRCGGPKDMVIDIDESTVKQAIELFAKEYAEEIDILKSKYGVVQLKYGLVKWCT